MDCFAADFPENLNVTIKIQKEQIIQHLDNVNGPVWTTHTFANSKNTKYLPSDFSSDTSIFSDKKLFESDLFEV